MFDNISAYKAYLKEHLYANYPNFCGIVDNQSFNEDFENLMNISRILVRNKEKVNVPMLVNRIIILHNVWGKEFIKCIPYLITDDSGLVAFNTVAIFLGILKQDESLRIDEKFFRMLSDLYHREARRVITQNKQTARFRNSK